MKKISNLPTEMHIDIKKEVFNDVYYPYLNKIYSREVYYGGGSSGKSHFISDKIVLQTTVIAERNVIILRKTNTSSRTSTFESITKSINRFHLQDVWNIVEHPNMRMTNITNKNTILFLGMDDVQKIKSITFSNGVLTDIWYEEVAEEEDERAIRQLEVRLRGGNQKKRMIVSYNPTSAQHFIKKMAEQEWKRKFGDDMIYLKTTYRDNKFLDKEDIQTLEDFRFSDPYMYQVYCLGEYGSSGKSVFDRNKISERLQALGDIYKENPPRVVDFKYERDDGGHILPNSFSPFDAIDGDTKIFVDVVPRHPYVMSLDPAGVGADFQAGHVFDNVTGEQVAVFHSALNPDQAVHQAFGLAKYYNNALFCPEVNMESFFLLEFKRLGYRNIYQRGNALDAYSEEYEQKLGFVTHGGNRKTMLSDCVKWVNLNINMINDVDTLNEMLTFSVLPKKQQGFVVGFTWGAEAGTHDDLVMSLAIVLQARQQCSTELSSELEGSLKGMWLPSQLKSAVEAGRITHEQKKEYERNHTGHVRLGTGINRNAIKRRSRYDR